MTAAPVRTACILVLALLASLALPARAADADGLVGALVSQLGVTPEQAAGGAGALLAGAQAKMAPGDWTQVAAAIPNIGGLLSAAPEAPAAPASSGFGGLLGQAAADMGADLGVAALAPAFQSLGLDPSLAAQFVPVIVGFVRSEAGQQTASLLASSLRGML